MRIDIDTCEEILITITRNKTRSLLTAFGVFWGIFMLVALIGGGQGMQEELKSQFEGFATNSGFIAAQKTSEAYKGFRNTERLQSPFRFQKVRMAFISPKVPA